MKKMVLLIFTLLLTACNDPKALNSQNFQNALNQNFMQKEGACTQVQKFPLDVVENLVDEDTNRELNALEKVGLVVSVEQQKPIVSIGDLSMQVKVRHYELTENGKKFYQPIPQADNFAKLCFAGMRVDKIVEWTEPVAASGEMVTTVTYTYKLVDIADWSKNPEIQNVFPAIKNIISDASKRQLRQFLHLTNNGWKVT